MKRFIAVGITVLALTTCSSPSAAGMTVKPTMQVIPDPRVEAKSVVWLEAQQKKVLEIERLAAEQTLKDQNSEKLNNAIAQVKAQVGKTWYVFSGSTPQGWDCSGLVRWMYEQVGITLEHRASVQKYAGEFVDEPKVGDIVAFSYGDGAFHVGIWLAPDTMLHAGGGEGQKTEIIPISSFERGSTVTYTRLLDTN